MLAALFAVTWLLFPGFGLVDLSVTWDPTSARVLAAGWGVFFTVLVGAAFVAVALTLRRAVGPAVQLYVVAAALAVAAPLAAEIGVLWLALLVFARSRNRLRTGHQSTRSRSDDVPARTYWILGNLAFVAPR